MTVTRRLSDAALVLRAKKIKTIETQIAELAQNKKKLESQIMAEMERRNSKVIENNGIRLNRVQATPLVYNWSALLAALSPKKRALCVKEVPDKAGLEAAVSAGVINPRLVAKHSEVTQNNPYLKITSVMQ